MNKAIQVERRAMKKVAREGIRGATDLQTLIEETARRYEGVEVRLSKWIRAHNKFHGGEVRAMRCGGECGFDEGGLAGVSGEAFDLDDVA